MRKDLTIIEERLVALSRALDRVGPALDEASRAELQGIHRDLDAARRGACEQCATSELILDSMADGVIVVDGQGQVLAFNAGARRIAEGHRGTTPAEEWKANTFYFREDGETPLDAPDLPLSRALRGEEVDGAITCIRSSAEDVWFVESSSRPIRDASGAICGGVSIFRDVTRSRSQQMAMARQAEELAQSRKELADKSRILQSVLDHMAEGVVVADTTGTFQMLNEAARIFGERPVLTKPPGEWQSYYGMFLPDMETPLPMDQIPLVRAMRGERVDNAEVFFRHPARPDGAWVSATARPMRDPDGQLAGAVVVFRDVTELKRAECDLKARAEALARSNEQLEEFAYVASHDLQQPLRTVTNFLQILQERYQGRLDADADRFIGAAVSGARRMHSLIQDLLAYSRVGRGGESAETLSTNAVLRDVLAALDRIVEETGAEVTVERLPPVFVNRSLLLQLFQNLIENGLKYRRSDVAPRIVVSARRSRGDWHFSVADNGIGIQPAHLDRIFRLFQRLHTRDQYPGNGIGLAIARRIVESLGGRIWVESEAGVGTTFHFTVPAIAPSEP